MSVTHLPFTLRTLTVRPPSVVMVKSPVKLRFILRPSTMWSISNLFTRSGWASRFCASFRGASLFLGAKIVKGSSETIQLSSYYWKIPAEIRRGMAYFVSSPPNPIMFAFSTFLLGSYPFSPISNYIWTSITSVSTFFKHVSRKFLFCCCLIVNTRPNQQFFIIPLPILEH